MMPSFYKESSFDLWNSIRKNPTPEASSVSDVETPVMRASVLEKHLAGADVVVLLDSGVWLLIRRHPLN